MNRRSIVQLLTAAAVFLPLTGRKAAAEAEPAAAGKKAHRLALHVDQNDPEVMKLALNNARNAHDLYQQRGETVAIEIVAYSQGLHMLRDDTSPVKEEIRALRKLDPSLALGACNNTKMGMEKKEGKPVKLISEATIVPAGIVRLVELQEQGYAYIKP
jgi:intracellular sulfur oxidation DsrE/DsrF family protein